MESLKAKTSVIRLGMQSPIRLLCNQLEWNHPPLAVEGAAKAAGSIFEASTSSERSVLFPHKEYFKQRAKRSTVTKEKQTVAARRWAGRHKTDRKIVRHQFPDPPSEGWTPEAGAAVD